MSNVAAYLEAEVMEWCFNAAGFDAAPTDLYVGLHTGDPGNDGSANEVSASDYTRAATTDADWSVFASDGPKDATNANEIRFDTAQNAWGTVSHVTIWTDTIANGGGDCLWQGPIDSARDIQSGDRFVFPADDFDLSLD